MPFAQAADKESLKTFFEELKVYLFDLQRTIEASFTVTKGAFNDFGPFCELYLYEDLIGDEDDDCERRICSLDFVLDEKEHTLCCRSDDEVSYWTPDQKAECFKQISRLIMRELSDHDQKHVNDAIERLKPIAE